MWDGIRKRGVFGEGSRKRSPLALRSRGTQSMLRRRSRSTSSKGTPPTICPCTQGRRSRNSKNKSMQKEDLSPLVMTFDHRSAHNPQFHKTSLERYRKKFGLKYVHMPGLGGLRHAKRDSPNGGWRNASFRGSADYMQTHEFVESLEEAIRTAKQDRIALMCVKHCLGAVMVADRGRLARSRIRTEDIMSATRRQIHTLTPFAKVRGTAVAYPAETSHPIPMPS